MSADTESLVERFALALDASQRRLLLAAGDEFAELDPAIGWLARNRSVNALRTVERRIGDDGVPHYRLTTLGAVCKAFLLQVAETPGYVPPTDDGPVFRVAPAAPPQADLEALAEALGLSRPGRADDTDPTLPGAAR